MLGAARRTHAHWRSVPPGPDSRRQGRPASVAHARSGPPPPPPSPLSAGACAVCVSRFPPPAALPFPLPGVLGSAERPAAGTVAAAGVRVQRRGGSAPAPARPRYGASRSSEGSGAAAAEVNPFPFLPLATFSSPSRFPSLLPTLLRVGRRGPSLFSRPSFGAGRAEGLVSVPAGVWCQFLTGSFLGFGCAPASFRVI